MRNEEKQKVLFGLLMAFNVFMVLIANNKWTAALSGGVVGAILVAWGFGVIEKELSQHEEAPI